MAVHNLTYPYLESIRHKPFVSTRKEISMKPKEYSKIVKPVLLAVITVALATVAVAPDILNVPLAWQPWLFVASIAWFVSYFTGTFNS